MLINSQWRQFLGCWQGLRSELVEVWSPVLVDALTSWSERFVFLLRPKINLASFKNLVVLDLLSKDKLDSMILPLGDW